MNIALQKLAHKTFNVYVERANLLLADRFEAAVVQQWIPTTLVE
jgi:hypothetical protein